MISPSLFWSLVGSSDLDSLRTATRFFVDGSESLILLRASIVALPLETGVRGFICSGDVEMFDTGSGMPSVRRKSIALRRLVESHVCPFQWIRWLRKLLWLIMDCR